MQSSKLALSVAVSAAAMAVALALAMLSLNPRPALTDIRSHKPLPAPDGSLEVNIPEPAWMMWAPLTADGQ